LYTFVHLAGTQFHTAPYKVSTWRCPEGGRGDVGEVSTFAAGGSKSVGLLLLLLSQF